MSIGSRIKEARTANNITQEYLAKIIGVSKGTIGNYETSRAIPKHPILIKLIEALQIDANFLYQDYIKVEKCTAEELRLVQLYRNANNHAREIILKTLEENI